MHSVIQWVGHLGRDLQYVARQARRMPLTTLLAVSTFALGIGAATTIGTLAYTALWRTLPFRDASQLVVIGTAAAAGNAMPELLTGPAIRDLEQRAEPLAQTAVYVPVGTWNLLWQRGGEQLPVDGTFVSPSFFSVLGPSALRGRTFTGSDQAPVAVVSEGFWRDALGGAPDVLGRTLDFPVSFTIVGVVPDAVALDEPVDVWLSMTPDALESLGPDRRSARLIARRKSGVSNDILAQRLAGGGLTTLTVADLRRALVGDARPRLMVLLAAVLAVVLLGCVNVTTLLLDRSVAREGELALRMALGAPASRIVAQVSAEAVALAGAGGVAGVSVAWLLARAAPAWAPASMLWVRDVRMDWKVIVASLALTTICGLAAALLPARRSWLAGQERVTRSYQSTPSRGTWRVRRGLATSQLAFAFALLVAAGLMVRSLIAVLNMDLGFRPQGVLALRLSTDIEDPSGRVAFYEALFDQVRAMPGVVDAGAASRLPLREGGAARMETADRLAGEAVAIELRRASTSYFPTMGVRVVEGRPFQGTDRSGAPPIALVNQTAARAYWPGGSPVGQRVRLQRPDGDAPWLTVIGVVNDVRHFGAERDPSPELYVPVEQGPPFSVLLVVRSSGDPRALATPIREAVRRLNPESAVLDAIHMESLVADGLAARRYTTRLLAAFGAVALLLAIVGVYATVSHVLNARRRELAIRMSLGATPRSVLRMGLLDALRSAVPGLATGALASLVGGRLISGLVFGIQPFDPLTYAAVSVGLAGAVLLASLAPAVRSAGLDPATVLRSD